MADDKLSVLALELFFWRNKFIEIAPGSFWIKKH
jgi:hypothetical protein